MTIILRNLTIILSGYNKSSFWKQDRAAVCIRSYRIKCKLQGACAEKQITMIIYFMMFLLMPACYLLLSHAVELQKRTDQNKILKVLSFPFGLLVPIALFITLLACSMVAWLKSTCGDVSFSIIVLQLTSPIKGTDSGVINSIIKTGIIPPLLVTLTISIVYLIMVRVLYNLEDLPVKKVPAWTKICLEIILLIALVGTIQVQGTKVGMWEYIKSV